MLLSISLNTGLPPVTEADARPPSDAHVSLDGLADLLFIPLEPPPALPLPEHVEITAPGEPAPPSDETLVDPQRWLSAMVNQQGVQLQARDAIEPRSTKRMPQQAMDRLLARLPMQAGLAMPIQADLGPQEQKLPVDKAGQGLPVYQASPTQSPVAGLLDAPSPDSLATRVMVAMQANVMTAPAVGVLDSLPAHSLATPSTLPVAASAAPLEPILERNFKLVDPQARWGEQMLHALRETVQVQVQQRFQQATIRLDPPELGSLEIFISHEPGRLNVQISAAQGDVARLLQHTSDRLRQELVEQNTLQVSVQISSDSQGHSGRNPSRQGREPDIAEAIREASSASPSAKHQANGVLVTV